MVTPVTWRGVVALSTTVPVAVAPPAGAAPKVTVTGPVPGYEPPVPAIVTENTEPVILAVPVAVVPPAGAAPKVTVGVVAVGYLPPLETVTLVTRVTVAVPLVISNSPHCAAEPLYSV